MPLLGMGVQVPPRTPAQTPGSPPGTGGSRICGPHPSQPARGARWPRPHRVLPPTARSRPQATPGGAPPPPGAGSGRLDHPITTTGHPWMGAPSAGGGQWSPRPPDHDHRPPRGRPSAGAGSGRLDHPITTTGHPWMGAPSAGGGQWSPRPPDHVHKLAADCHIECSHRQAIGDRRMLDERGVPQPTGPLPVTRRTRPGARPRWHSTGRATAGALDRAPPRVALGRSPQPAT